MKSGSERGAADSTEGACDDNDDDGGRGNRGVRVGFSDRVEDACDGAGGNIDGGGAGVDIFAGSAGLSRQDTFEIESDGHTSGLSTSGLSSRDTSRGMLLSSLGGH